MSIIEEEIRRNSNNKDFMLNAINNGASLFLASENLKNDPEIVRAAIEKSSIELYFIGDKLKKDLFFMLEILSKSKDFEQKFIMEEIVDNTLKNDYVFMSLAKQINIELVKYIGDELKNDFIFMLSVIDKIENNTFFNILMDRVLGSKLKNNERFMDAVISINKEAIKYIGDELRNNSNFMLSVIKQCDNNQDIDFIMNYIINPDLKKKKKFMFFAISNNNYLIRFIDPELKKDYNLMLSILLNSDEKEHNYIMNYIIDDKLKDNRMFMGAAISNNPDLIKYIGDKLSNNYEFMLFVIEKCRNDSELEMVMNQILSSDLKNSKKFILNSVKINPDVAKYINSFLQNDFDIVTELLKGNKNYKSNLNYIEGAINRFGVKMLAYADENIKNNLNLVSSFISRGKFDILKYAGDSIKNNSLFILEIIHRYGPGFFEYAGENIKNDKIIVRALVKEWILHKEFLLENMGETLKNDPNFMLEIFQILRRYEEPYEKKYAIEINYLGNELKNDYNFILKLEEIYGNSIMKFPEIKDILTNKEKSDKKINEEPSEKNPTYLSDKFIQKSDEKIKFDEEETKRKVEKDEYQKEIEKKKELIDKIMTLSKSNSRK